MRSIVIRGHLGLGDHLICNGLVKEYASQYDRVIVPCKQHNEPSVRQMFLDDARIHAVAVRDDSDADKVSSLFEESGSDLLNLGMFGEKPFDIMRWDSEMYRQAGVTFETRWERFSFQIPEDFQLADPGGFAFVHDDPSRGFKMRKSELPGIPHCRPSPAGTIFHWVPHILAAKEIHCIDSCFAILVDSLKDISAERLVLHLYARRDKPPHYRKQWEVLE